MKKLIYLEDAIDALEQVARLFPYKVPGERDTYDTYNQAWNDAIGRAEIELEELPSAYTAEEIKKIQDMEQAEIEKAFQLGVEDAQPEITTCENCKYGNAKPIADGRRWCNRHGAYLYYCSDAEVRVDD